MKIKKKLRKVNFQTSLHDDSGWRTDKLIDPEIGKATAQFIAKMW